jgi:hypothetical protein
MLTECNHNSLESTMKDLFSIIGTLLSLMILLFVLDLVFDPAQAQVFQ